MSQMSEWVRKSKIQKDLLFRPVPADSHWKKEIQDRKEQQAHGRVTKDAVTHDVVQNLHRVPPVHVHQGVNNSIHTMKPQTSDGSLFVSSSQFLSTQDSSFRSETGPQSCLDQLKDREAYQKLLQQHTEISLGYHGSRNKPGHRHEVSNKCLQSQRCQSAHLPLPDASFASTSLSTSAGFNDSKKDTCRSGPQDVVTPSHVVDVSSPLSGLTVGMLVPSSSSVVSNERRLAMPHSSGRRHLGYTLPAAGALSSHEYNKRTLGGGVPFSCHGDKMQPSVQPLSLQAPSLQSSSLQPLSLQSSSLQSWSLQPLSLQSSSLLAPSLQLSSLQSSRRDMVAVTRLSERQLQEPASHHSETQTSVLSVKEQTLSPDGGVCHHRLQSSILPRKDRSSLLCSSGRGLQEPASHHLEPQIHWNAREGEEPQTSALSIEEQTIVPPGGSIQAPSSHHRRLQSSMLSSEDRSALPCSSGRGLQELASHHLEHQLSGLSIKQQTVVPLDGGMQEHSSHSHRLQSSELSSQDRSAMPCSSGRGLQEHALHHSDPPPQSSIQSIKELTPLSLDRGMQEHLSHHHRQQLSVLPEEDGSDMSCCARRELREYSVHQSEPQSSVLSITQQTEVPLDGGIQELSLHHHTLPSSLFRVEGKASMPGLTVGGMGDVSSHHSIRQWLPHSVTERSAVTPGSFEELSSTCSGLKILSSSSAVPLSVDGCSYGYSSSHVECKTQQKYIPLSDKEKTDERDPSSDDLRNLAAARDTSAGGDASLRDRKKPTTKTDMKLWKDRKEETDGLEDKLRQMRLFDEEKGVKEEPPVPSIPHKPLPELTDVMLKEIKAALASGSPNEVLSEGFRLRLTRADIGTLRGLNWLNDEVINFYMNLLMERGKQEGFAKTYAFNTFFYTKLIGGGHSAVKRWTRKVDIFLYRYLVVPVHLGVHWCLCMVFMEEKKICFYDSMGGNNKQCLAAVRKYVGDESAEKRNVQLDMSQWSLHTVKDIPQQMNGSDCGVFACMFAEVLTRGDDIMLTQEDMPYFRQRMVYEILKKKLL